MYLSAGNVTAPRQSDITGSQGVFLETVNKLQFNNNLSRVKVSFCADMQELLESVTRYQGVAVSLAHYTCSCCAFVVFHVDGFTSSWAIVSWDWTICGRGLEVREARLLVQMVGTTHSGGESGHYSLAPSMSIVPVSMNRMGQMLRRSIK